MLMHDHTAQLLEILRNPDRIVDRKAKFAWVHRCLVANAVVRRVGSRKNIVRRLLSDSSHWHRAEHCNEAPHREARWASHRFVPQEIRTSLCNGLMNKVPRRLNGQLQMN